MGTKRRWLRGILWTFGVLVALSAAAWVALYVHTERALQGETLASTTVLPAGHAEEGERLARLLGCTACHGDGLGGREFVHIPNVARIIAPNLTNLQAEYDEAAFLRLMRAGTKADGRLALVMPNKAHQRLSDQELADLWAHVSALPQSPDTLPATRIHALGRVGVLLGEYDVDAMRADPPESEAVLAERTGSDPGRRLLQVACGECHGLDLAGNAADAVPPLLVLKGYSHEQFIQLMHEGLNIAGVDTATGLMSSVARRRFTVLTEDEVRLMKDYIDRH